MQWHTTDSACEIVPTVIHKIMRLLFTYKTQSTTLTCICSLQKQQ